MRDRDAALDGAIHEVAAVPGDALVRLLFPDAQMCCDFNARCSSISSVSRPSRRIVGRTSAVTTSQSPPRQPGAALVGGVPRWNASSVLSQGVRLPPCGHLGYDSQPGGHAGCMAGGLWPDFGLHCCVYRSAWNNS